jgi:hypothetical protein
MSDTSGRHRWITVTGYVAWLTPGLPVLLEILFPSDRFLEAALNGATFGAWIAAFAGFGVAYTVFV